MLSKLPPARVHIVDASRDAGVVGASVSSVVSHLVQARSYSRICVTPDSQSNNRMLGGGLLNGQLNGWAHPIPPGAYMAIGTPEKPAFSKAIQPPRVQPTSAR